MIVPISFKSGSAALHIILTIRIRQYKIKQQKNDMLCKSKNNSFLFSIENKAVESIGLIFAIVFIVLFGFCTTNKVNSLSIVEINFYPSYLYVNFYHLMHVMILDGIFSITYLLKQKKMKQFIFKELKIFLGLG